MPRFLKMAMVLLLAVFLSAAGALFAFRGGFGPPAPDPLAPDPTLAGLSFPEFKLTDQDGKPVTRDVFRGRVTILDFLFTNCPFVCPVLAEKMHEMSNRLADTPTRYLSISVDPEHDTPEALKKFAALHEADMTRWTFATGDRATIDSIVSKGLHFDLEPDAKNTIKLDNGGTMQNIVHPSWFLLVGPDGMVLGLYQSSSPEDIEALVARAREASGRIGTRK